MRKIDKTTILSTVYKRWEETLEQRQEQHPDYTSSNFKYYLDVVMNLFYCQHGLCAYTEMRLCTEKLDFSPEHWQNGRYVRKKPDFSGQLDHFDSSLKARKAWLWSNLFMVQSDINVKIKHDQTVDHILKPDTEEYDPFRLLAYDAHTHFFIANPDLPEAEQQRITGMLKILGINFGPIRARRREVLMKQFAMIKFGVVTWDDAPDEFITSFDMCKRDHQA